MTAPLRLGMLTPSSNTVLEPVTAAMLAGVPGASAHFGRFRVTEISLSQKALSQFDPEPMLAAADLLADAHCQSLCWNGTSAGWLGFDKDRALCATIRERTGIPASSSVLALADLFRIAGVRTFGLVSPYIPEVQNGIIENFRREGYVCIAERHLGITVNFDFALTTADTLRRMIREVAAEGPDGIVVLCTNLAGGPLVAELEAETGVTIYDSIATAVWGALVAAGADPRAVRGYGRLFDLPAALRETA
ncbi:MAG: aspartate/glutamate racemase family protein [Pseudomonadota bacterium]|nr:aspartate/glutamate racemase family protein [Pseudomonadota bacterium]